MKESILAVATQEDVSTSHMDVGMVDNVQQVPVQQQVSEPRTVQTFAIDTPEKQKGISQSVEVPVNQAENGTSPKVNPNIRCFTCNGVGHPARLCPLKDTGEGKGKMSTAITTYNPNWQPKGWGKGWFEGKGKGKGGKGAYNVEEEWDWTESDWGPSAFTGMICEICDEESPNEDDFHFDDDADESINGVAIENGSPDPWDPSTFRTKKQARAYMRQVQREIDMIEGPRYREELHAGVERIKSEKNAEKDTVSEMIECRCRKCGKVQVNVVDAVVSCCKGAEIVDVEGNAVAAWSVPVTKAKKSKKRTSNQRRAAARGRKTFAGVIEEENPEAVFNTNDEWERLELTVDSGAAETICPGAQATNVPTVPGLKAQQGVRYTCAGGKRIPNLGEKRCLMCTDESSTEHRLTMQVADVNRALLSVCKAVDGGNRVVFDKDWSYIEDVRTGERTTIHRRGGLYVLETWARARKDQHPPGQPPFGGHGDKK